LHRYTNRSKALQAPHTLTIVGGTLLVAENSHTDIEFIGFSPYQRINGAT
jgi:hypothetical protein